MKRIGNYLTTLLFLGFIFTVGIYIQFDEDQKISFNENRSLAQKTPITKETILDGTFVRDYEKYFTDQFPGRYIWIQGYLQWQQLTDQTYYLDYYVHKDNWIYPKPMNYFAGESINTSTQYLGELESFLKEKEIEFYFFFLPARTVVLDAPYPSYIDKGYVRENRDYFMEKVPRDYLRTVDFTKDFREKFTQDELRKLYYQTDHHWNINGAFEGYRLIHHSFKETSDFFDEPDFDDSLFETTCFPQENFLGSYNKQLFSMVDSKDAACIMTPTNFDFNDFEVYAGEIRADLKVPWDKIYSRNINKGNKLVEYSGVFTEDHRELNIINPHKKKDDTKVLFLKDSYANPLTLLLSQHFYQTTFYDIRYNQDRSLYEYLEGKDFDVIAILYNDVTIFPGMYDFHLQQK